MLISAYEITHSLMVQRLQQSQGSPARVQPGATRLDAEGLRDSVTGRANLLATQEVAWAKLSTLPSPREIAWSRCKTKVPA
jgi:hypothetical protein